MRKLLVALVLCAGLAAASGAASGSARHPAAGRAALTGEISVVYSETYTFDSKDLADRWWSSIKKQFEASYPGAKLNLLPVQGTDVDEQKKIALLLRSPSTAPDVMSLETTSVGQLAASNYLLPLDAYTAKDRSFWPSFPQNVKRLGMVGGKVYAIDSGNNVSVLYYNIAMLRKAGVHLPWRPRTWNDILSAARKVKRAEPNVTPLWVHSGVNVGPFVTVVQSFGNLIYGSTTPKMFDTKTGKWVVSSPGLTSALTFYRTVFAEKLGPPVGAMFNPQAAVLVPDEFRKHQLAIAIGSNWFPGSWVFKFATPWPQAGKEIGVAPVPTQNGQAPGAASTIAGWAFAVSRASKHPDLAWALIRLMQEDKNSLDMANWSGFVPPSRRVASSAAFNRFAPPQGKFKDFVRFGIPLPSDPSFPVYGRALDEATGKLAQDPGASLADVLKGIRDTMVTEVGSDHVESIR